MRRRPEGEELGGPRRRDAQQDRAQLVQKLAPYPAHILDLDDLTLPHLQIDFSQFPPGARVGRSLIRKARRLNALDDFLLEVLGVPFATAWPRVPPGPAWLSRHPLFHELPQPTGRHAQAIGRLGRGEPSTAGLLARRGPLPLLARSLCRLRAGTRQLGHLRRGKRNRVFQKSVASQ